MVPHQRREQQSSVGWNPNRQSRPKKVCLSKLVDGNGCPVKVVRPIKKPFKEKYFFLLLIKINYV